MVSKVNRARPTVPENPCGICHKNVHAHCKSVFCNNCSLRVHLRCNNISILKYNKHQDEADDMPWFCLNCTKTMFPFGQLDNEELLNLYGCDIPSWVDSVPSFEITSGLTNLPNFGDYRIDEHLPSNITLIIILSRMYLLLVIRKMIFLYFI